MQNGAYARKLRVTYDGVEIEGLVKVGEVTLESNLIDVPSYNRIFKIQSGVLTMPEVTFTYKCNAADDRAKKGTKKFFRDWYKQSKVVGTMQLILVDASNAEIERTTWTDVECRRFSEPEMDLASPSYGRIDVVLIPYDIN